MAQIKLHTAMIGDGDPEEQFVTNLHDLQWQIKQFQEECYTEHPKTRGGKSVFILTAETTNKHEQITLVVADPGQLANAFMHMIIGEGDMFTGKVFMFEMDTWENAYKIAKDMQEVTDICYENPYIRVPFGAA